MKTLEQVYADASIVIRTKAPQVRVMLIALSALLLLIIVGDLLAGEVLNAALESVIIAALLASLLMLYRGRFRVASIVPIVVSTLALVGLALGLDFASRHQVYNVTLYMIPPLILATTISEHEWFTIVTGGVGVLSILGISWFLVAPAAQDATVRLVRSEILTTAVLIYLIVVVMAVLISNRTRRALQEVEEAAAQSSTTLRRVLEVSDEARESMTSSRSVEQDYQGVLENLRQIREQVAVLEQNISSLRDTMTQGLGAIRAIAERVQGFHGQVDEQNTVVQESTAAVNQMSASLDSVAGITSTRKQASDRLLEVVGEGRKALEATNSAFRTANNQMNSMLEINEIVSDIAARTNLLSMNAAIEAAHAGDSGRGFAVVAEEIRKLAGSTAENSQIIEETLKRVMHSISETSGHSTRTMQVMEEISTEVREVSDAFEEITGSTAELSQGGREIMNAMQVLQDTSITVRDGSDQISRDQDAARDQMEQVEEIVQGMTHAAEEVTSAVASIDESMKYLHGAIEGSSSQSAQLHDSINELAGNLS